MKGRERIRNDRRSSGDMLRQKNAWLNLIWVSISINQHQSAPTSINYHINQHQSESYLIFVTGHWCLWRKNMSCEHTLWRNSPQSCGEILHITDCQAEKYLHRVKIGENLPNRGIFPHERCGHKTILSQFTLFSCKICFVTNYAVLSRNLFCRDLRAFA